MSTISPRDASWREDLRKAHTAKERSAIPRAKMTELAPDYRVTCNEEVNQGLSREQAVLEATRCLDCPDPQCVTGCPVGINIPGFIKNIERENFGDAAIVLKETSALPAVCGRVCPQERQCESKCIYNKMKKEPVAIGYLERFAADTERLSGNSALPAREAANGIKVAVVGSGPASLSFAGDMAKRGFVDAELHVLGSRKPFGVHSAANRNGGGKDFGIAYRQVERSHAAHRQPHYINTVFVDLRHCQISIQQLHQGVENGRGFL